MKKQKLMIHSVVLSLSLIVGLIPASALEDSSPRKILLDIGYPIEIVNDMNDDHIRELANAYQRSPDNFELTVEYLSLTSEGDLETCASISDSDLFFTQAILSNDPATGCSYTVAIDFSWNTCKSAWRYNDKIIVAWGGNLYRTGTRGYVKYYYPGQTLGTWGSFYTQENMDYTVSAINAGGYYSFPIFVSSLTPQVKYGTIEYTIGQDSVFSNVQSAVIAQYARETVKTTGNISVSLSGPSASITIGSGHDTSKQVSSALRY